MQLLLAHIPETLKKIPHWVLWRLEERAGKLTKVPYQAGTGQLASTTDEATWTDFEQAARAKDEPGVDGIGFVFTMPEGIVGVDLDHCRDAVTGKIDDWARAIIRRLKSYTEVTPSGTGVHILVRGRLPEKGRKKGAVEMYGAGRYFTVTGQRLGHIEEIEDRTEELFLLHREVFGESRPSVSGPTAAAISERADEEIVRLVRRNPKFDAVWRGDSSAYATDKHKGTSEADAALCSQIAFYTGPDRAAIDRIFRSSPRMREKWDSMEHGTPGITWGDTTINFVLHGRGPDDYYNWRQPHVPPPTDRDDHTALANSAADAAPVSEDELEAALPIHRTDLGNAMLMEARFGEDIRWSGERGWLLFDGVRWREDKTEGLEKLAARVVKRLWIEGLRGPAEERDDALKWAAKSEARPRIEAMCELVKSQGEVAVTAAAFDGDAYVVGHPEGVLVLGPSTKHRPSTRDDMITRHLGTAYSRGATCPRWERFLQEVMLNRQELVDFIQRAVGYSLTGSVTEQCLFFLHGLGENGKSTLLSVLIRLWGDYGMVAPPGLLLEKYREQHPTEIADLSGKRLVVSEEVGEGKRLAEELVKRLTGGLPMKGRWMNRDFFQFNPEFKLWLAANHKPEIRGTDHAIWRRIYLIPFDARFGEEGGTPKEPELLDTLFAELPGILNWALAGCSLWSRRRLEAPEAVKAATAEYREEMDIIGWFLSESCILGEGLHCLSLALYLSYTTLCERSGEKPISNKVFSQRLREKGYASKHTERGARWDGLGLKDNQGNDEPAPFFQGEV